MILKNIGENSLPNIFHQCNKGVKLDIGVIKRQIATKNWI
jgi:hypothetical protein